VSSGDRVTTIGYESCRSERPSTALPTAGSSIASIVWTRSRLRSSVGIAASVRASRAHRDHPIG
jgi:hypothetical protein